MTDNYECIITGNDLKRINILSLIASVVIF